MSKILIGSDIEKVEMLKNHFIKYGFEKYSHYTGDGISTYCFKKLKIDNSNFIEIGSDFVATSGTLIYRKVIGKDALEKIYKDFVKGIDYIRKNAVGNYCLVIKKDGILYIVTDENAIHNIYYYNDNDWMITNTFYHLAKVIDNVSVNQLEMLEYSFQYGIIGNKTPYKKIYKLMGEEYIKVDLSNNNFSINKINTEEDRVKTTDNSSKSIAKMLEEQAQIISNNFSKVTVSMTGGLDSRIIMAALLKNGVKPQIVYGVGNSPLTNTKNKDLEINKMYADKFNLEFKPMNWKTNEPIEEYWDYSLQKYGELFTVYAGNQNVYDEFEKNIDFDYITFGYFGELMRNADLIEPLQSDFFNINQFVDLYINDDIPIEKDLKEKLYENILEKYTEICKIEKIDALKIHKDKATRIHSHYRKRADVQLCNLSNIYASSTIMLSEENLFESILNIKYNDKGNAKYMLQVMYELYPEILDIPFFSHCRDCIFNLETFELDNVQSKNKIIQELKKYINKTRYAKIIKKLYSHTLKVDEKDTLQNKKNKEIKIQFINYLKEQNDPLINIDNFSGDVRALARYSQLVFMNNSLKRIERSK